MHQRLLVAVADQGGGFFAVVVGTADADLCAGGVEDAHDIAFLEFADDMGDANQ